MLNIGIKEKRIPEIDYLKGFSIFTIALMHLISMLPSIPSVVKKLSAIGGSGVHVFFLCSGIGLYLSYLNNRVNYYEFIKKRFFKIFVPYIIVVFISFLVPWMYTGDDRFIALVSHICIFKMFVPRYNESFGFHFWFISTIIQFYLIFIPLCKIKEKVGGLKFVLVSIIISVVWWISCYYFGVTEIRVWNSCFLQYLWEFSLGMILAYGFYQGKTIRIKGIFLVFFAMIGIGIQAFMAMKSETLKIFNDIPALVGYLSLAFLFMGFPVIKKMISKLSSISYEYYLVHILIFASVIHFINKDSLLYQVLIGVMGIVIAIGISYLYHRLIIILMNKSR